jgi:hypothetical protein
MKLKWIATAAVIGTIIMIGCAQVQDLGRGVGGPLGGVITGVATASQAGTLTEKDEDTFGRCLAVSVTNQYKVSSDRKLVTYVNYIGHTLGGGVVAAGSAFHIWCAGDGAGWGVFGAEWVCLYHAGSDRSWAG